MTIQMLQNVFEKCYISGLVVKYLVNMFICFIHTVSIMSEQFKDTFGWIGLFINREYSRDHIIKI